MSFAGSIGSRELVRVRDAEDFPVKLYTFEDTMGPIYQHPKSSWQYLLDVLAKNQKLGLARNPYLYAIAIAWGYKDNGPVKAIDIFSYKFDKPWDLCNPEFDKLVAHNGKEPKNRTVTCETGSIILGAEGKLRRETHNIREFIYAWPDIGDLYHKSTGNLLYTSEGI